MKRALFVFVAVLLALGWMHWLQYRRCLPLPGATSVKVYVLSPLPEGSRPITIPASIALYPLPRERVFGLAARIDRKVILGSGAASSLNALLSDPASYHEQFCPRLHFDTRYALVMSSKSGGIEVLIDRSISAMRICRHTAAGIEKTKILSLDADWVAFVKKVFPNDPDLNFRK